MRSAGIQTPEIGGRVTADADVRRWLPIRVNGRDVNKGSYGHVLVIAGSRGFAGAPVLAAEAAARSGAGIVTLAVPEDIWQATTARVSPVVMTLGLAQTDAGTLTRASLDRALRISEKATSVAIGPGLGQGDELRAFVREFAARCAVPLVVDADALNGLAQEADHGESVIRGRSTATVLTPHPGEMGRLLGISTRGVQDDRRSAAVQAASRFQCVALLKGDRTLVAAPDGTLYSNATGNPGMASGGMGDVLSGVLAALLSQHLPPLHAAAAGAYIHGRAGDLAANAQGGATGLWATDLISCLPRAIACCQNCPGDAGP